MTRKPTTISYEVRVVGNIWMPPTRCAYHVTVKGSDLMELSRADNETDKEYEVRMVQVTADFQLGDFQSIDAWEIERHAVTVQHSAHHKDGMRSLDYAETTQRRVDTLCVFDADAEESYMLAMGNE